MKVDGAISLTTRGQENWYGTPYHSRLFTNSGSGSILSAAEYKWRGLKTNPPTAMDS